MYKRPIRLPRSFIERPQQGLPKRTRLHTWSLRIAYFFVRRVRASLWFYQRFLRRVHAADQHLSQLSEAEFDQHIQQLKDSLKREGLTDALLCQSFATVREAAGRTLGMRHFDSQLLGGLAMFHGNIAEMQTGEGKTLTATLSAATAAMAGVPVHVVTVNDYLTARDAEEMRPVYERLGLSLGVIIHGLSPQERRQIYAQNVVYCTNKELVFDFLKDSIQIEGKQHRLNLHAERLKGNQALLDNIMMQGLHFAIVDEADSVLLDEARTPLIISGEEIEQTDQKAVFVQAMELADQLILNRHYKVIAREHRVEFTPLGEEHVLALTEDLGPFWVGRVRCLELVHKALTATHLFKKNKQYIVDEGKIVIIDEHTGRMMADRTWEQGLHQLIEIKEGCDLSNPRETLAKISFQNFFRFYHHLGGMTGTAKEVSKELWYVYELPVVRIPTHKKSQRQQLGCTVYKTEQEKWQAVAQRIQKVHQQGRPILVGTHSVAASEKLSDLLMDMGIEHQLLNAKMDKQEADIVQCAGEHGAVTIATNMAGRGTDIKLPKEVERVGGLHVILTELHDASRIDRQLEGRCARQGDRGSFERLLSLDDAILSDKGASVLRAIMDAPLPFVVRNWLIMQLMRFAQIRLEQEHARLRAELLKADEKQRELLSFTSSKI